VPNFGQPGKGPVLQPGMTLAIEPMINLGTYRVDTLSNGWTVRTRDRKRSAHFEHTVLVAADGPAEILTCVEKK
jgi:methionyl aminopeptidase